MPPNVKTDLCKPQKGLASLELERPGAKTLKDSGHAETKHVAEKRERVKVDRVGSAAERGDRKAEDRTGATTASMPLMYYW
ncbi:hypothetical protein SNOG_07078 [Parastagonospora nodorum SN15]|uniref:Uncharacterized protein n=1 Tax=Phaeosphaeria nodorum (strain SN15 / ATCC MYA-4574 / FGSC 10173) TaxID=321614 RepID=Q0UMD6_PHANO|nr:hypothetical protein SNOG_07078 [Parastagonospora nodorum SN15]EAT85729.1 hypothetical protein SNOG_07078 [Parastagonospora nodorum SN15]